MIIRRKYLTYGQLYSDEPSRVVIQNILGKHNVPDAFKDFILDPDNVSFVYVYEMGMGIPWAAYEEMLQEFEELDKTHPFDNGLAYGDVTQASTYRNKEGNALMVLLISKPDKRPCRIVQVIAIENKNGTTEFTKPWNYGFYYLG